MKIRKNKNFLSKSLDWHFRYALTVFVIVIPPGFSIMKSFGGNDMKKSFDNFLRGLFERSLTIDNQDNGESIDDTQVISEFRKILDRMSIELIHTTFDNEKLLETMLSLSRMERIIIVFNIILGMEVSEIAYLLNITPDSVYTQKCNALKKLRQNMNAE